MLETTIQSRLICNGNRTEWSTIRGVIEPDYPELYSTQFYYQFIVSITKCENLSLAWKKKDSKSKTRSVTFSLNVMGVAVENILINTGSSPYNQLF